MIKTKTDLQNKFTSLSGIKKGVEEIVGLQKGIVYISPLYGSAKSFFVKALSEQSKNIVLLLPDVKSVNEIFVELNILNLGERTILLDSLEPENVQRAVSKIVELKNYILVSLFSLLDVTLPKKEKILEKTTKLQSGDEIDYETLIGYFEESKYYKENYVAEPGQFAIRGAVVDFWSYSEKYPCRIELDGDFVESIRFFDPVTQRSYKELESITIAENFSDEVFNSDVFEYIKDSLILVKDTDLTEILESEENAAVDKEEIEEELSNELFGVRKKELTQNKFTTKKFASVSELEKTGVLWVIENYLQNNSSKIEPSFRPAPPINSNFKILAEILKKYSADNFEIIITTENEIQEKRLSDLLTDYNEETLQLFNEGKLKVKTLPIKEGFVDLESKVFVLTDYFIFNKPYRQRVRKATKPVRGGIKDLSSLKVGDYVVHENFGIGKYAGLETIKIGETSQESIKIVYADGGVVYVNLNYLSLVKKFSSKEGVRPKLNSLSSSEWKRKKKKVKSKIKDAARELIKLYAQRKSAKGFKFSPDTVWQKELESSFIYEPTHDQLRVTEEVKADMETENPMDRLICGDVGFGKTEVAVRAAFKAVNDGKQVCLLVPTTILAEQHFNTFKERLSQFPVNVEALSRFQSKKKQEEIIEGLKKGTVDIVIGTHRLLSKDVAFKDLGLLIIDEEHRFGVMAKEKLKKLKVNVDSLALTATPIPRTLNMSLLGARDLSIISTHPPNRQPVYTKIEKFDIKKIRNWIKKEIYRGGQVYFVHDRVESIEKLANYVQKHIPDVSIAIAHGKMTPAKLEKVIHDFYNGKYDVLISTKIIESGIDIPNVNTIIVNRADRFGLAELHQLRGRVGRSDRQAYAYFVVPSINAITKKALKRLQAIEEYSDLGEGFSIAMRDLEIRGAGNLLGTEQSGIVDYVGFDLYLKLLDEAVNELKKEEFADVFSELKEHPQRSQPKIEAYFYLGIPKDFMPNQEDRLYYYSRLFSANEETEIEETIEEIKDTFGKIPETLERLFLAAKLRLWASIVLFEKVAFLKNKIVFALPKSDNEEFYKNNFTKLIRFISEKRPNFSFRQGESTMSLHVNYDTSNQNEALNFAIDFCKEVEEITKR